VLANRAKRLEELDTEEALEELKDNIFRRNEINIKLELAQSELNFQLNMALRNCLNITASELSKIDLNERIFLFLMLAEKLTQG
jgi:hypothetical protein